jgi:uncharacterized protein (DUF1501 family)
VVVFMIGGADTFNMLVPKNAICKLYYQYRTVRTNMALKEEELLEIPTPGQVCTAFGVHKSMPFLKSLYTEGQLGSLATLATWQSPRRKKA